MDTSERPTQRFNSASKPNQTQTNSTSLSSSSSGGSLRRRSTDTKYPADLVQNKRVKSKVVKLRQKTKQFLTVWQQGEQQDKHGDRQQLRKIPHFTIFNDRRELPNNLSFMSRCHSARTLTEVEQQKKQDEQAKKLISKLNSPLDLNEFNLGKSNSKQFVHQQVYTSQLCQPIGEIHETEDPRYAERLASQKNSIGNELQKIIVDEIDDKKKHRQQREQPVIESIEEERNDDDSIGQQIRTALSKLHEQKGFIIKMNNSEEVKVDLMQVDSQSITLLTETIKQENEAEND